MPYVDADGRVVQSRPWSLKAAKDVVWACATFVVLFFRGLFHLDDPVSQGQYGNNRRTNGPGYPRRRMGGFGSQGASPAPPPCGTGG